MPTQAESFQLLKQIYQNTRYLDFELRGRMKQGKAQKMKSRKGHGLATTDSLNINSLILNRLEIKYSMFVSPSKYLQFDLCL